MLYAIVNNGVIIFGPMHWEPGTFTKQLQGEGVNVSLPSTAPSEVIELTNTIRVMPVSEEIPAHDSAWQYLDGPNCLIGSTSITATYEVVDRPLDEIKTRLLARIDAAAENARLQIITSGSGQAMVYLEKRDEATRCMADPTPTTEDYPYMAAEIGVTAPTTNNNVDDLHAVATAIITTANAWTALSCQIEGIRLTAKKAVMAATTGEEAVAAGIVVFP